MDAYTTRATGGAALAPLSNKQKRTLILLAKRAFRRCMELGTIEETTDFDAWRHHQQVMAVERGSLTVCTNEDFNFLKAHYLGQIGQTERANEIRVKAACEPRIWAKHKLDAECDAAADVLPHAREYAAGFLRNARGVDMDSASPKQLWHAVYVVRRRAAQLRRKTV